MKLLNNAMGQGTIMAFFTLIIGFIVVVSLLPVLNALMGVVNTMDLSNLGMSSTITLLLGISGLLMIILFIMGVVADFQVRQRYQE